MRLLKPFLIILFGWAFTVDAQINTIKFEHFTTNEDLSQSTVKCIQQDNLGFMWFGTINGLNRFDGLNFSSYHFSPQDSSSLTSSHITALFEDSKGNFWIGTPDGLNKLIRETNNFQRFIHSKENLNTLPNNYIQDILEDNKGNLWIATRGGLSKYHNETNRFETFQKDAPNAVGMRSNRVSCIYEDKNKDLWIGYSGLDGLQKFDQDNQKFETFLFNQDELENTPLNVTIWDVFEDSQNNFWIATNKNGLLLLDRSTKEYIVYQENEGDKFGINASSIMDIDEDDSGNLLIATDGGGLNVLNLETFVKDAPQFAQYQVEPLNAKSINDNFLQSIFKDKTGLIWIGSKDSGINKIDKGIQKFTHYQSNQIAGNNLTNKDIWSISQDHVGNVWVGTADGLNRIDEERVNIEYFHHSPSDSRTINSNHIYSIFEDKSLDLWIGTDKGLNKLPFGKVSNPNFISYTHDEDDKNSISNNLISCMLEDYNGNFWIGTNEGLNLMNRENNTFKRFYNDKNDASNIIRCMILDKKERLWLGTEGGLARFNPQNNKFTSFLYEEGNPNSLRSNIINSIYVDIDGNIWLGTPVGLIKMTEDKGQITFEYDGFPTNTIYAIRGDRKGNLWLSTNTGLIKFHPRKKSTKNFNNMDGLQDGEFNPNASYKNYKGELFFGGSDGLNIFQPEKLVTNEEKPKVILTDFVINYESVEARPDGQLKKHINIAESVTLFPGDNKGFSFEFVALNYTQSEKNSYKFKLENYDDTWKYTNNQNIAFYTNIDPGNYVFKVQAANNDGVWNEEGTSIKVNIQPTFIQTLYFKVALLLSAIGLGYLIYLNRVRSLRQRSETLEKMVKERTEQLEKKNNELATTVKTLEDTQQQLVVSEKMASLGQLTAGIAHEINNPINFISSNVHALKMDFQDMQNVLKKVKELENAKDPVKLTNELILLGKQLDFDLLEEEISELLGGIERGTERTVNIVSSLRTFSRNSTDNFSRADIHEGLDSTITILNSQLNGHISIKKVYGDIPLIKCQISRLNQVFLNIINNSIQAINAKSNGVLHPGLIKIGTQKMGDQIQISIKDNGNGMDETTRKRLFEPFYTTKDVGEGTGLGLSISYGIIEQHNGKIDVFSAPGEGTEFLIYLPLDGEKT